MRVLITGAAGFLGQRLCRMLIEKGQLADRDGVLRPITQIHLCDLAPISLPPDHGNIELIQWQGDLADPAFVARLAAVRYDSLFHLASLLTLHAEQDPDQAYLVNVAAFRALIGAAVECPLVVFASSIAVFGGDLPARVDDTVVPAPATTYGTHKAINELLLADASRQGRIDGRSLRLPIVLLRPMAARQPAVSDRVADILRGPLDGRAVSSPLAADTAVPVASSGAVCRALLMLHDLSADLLPARRAFNLPALTVTIDQMMAAVMRHRGKADVTYRVDPALQKIVAGWPQYFDSDLARQLGITADPDLEAIIADYLDHERL